MTSISRKTLSQMVTSKGHNLFDLSMSSPVLLIFLRHFGCVFCREAVIDIAKRKEDFRKKSVLPIFVHMGQDEEAERFFREFGIDDAGHIADPECRYYKMFGLMKGRFNQLYGLRVWIRGFQTLLDDGPAFHLKQIGDGLQMPGVFLLKDGEVRSEYVHQQISDRPDYNHLINCC